MMENSVVINGFNSGYLSDMEKDFAETLEELCIMNFRDIVDNIWSYVLADMTICMYLQMILGYFDVDNT